MVYGESFEKYRRQLVKEGLIKSVFMGIILGGAALSLTAFFTWLFGYKPGLFFALAAFVVVACVTTPLFYFLRYKPTVKQIAKRVDALGMEERVLTMTELRNDDSFIARVQREDTSRVLKKTDSSLLKMAFSVVLIVFVAVAGVFSLGFTTVSALHYAGIIPSGITTIEYIRPKGVFTVSYSVMEGCEGTVIYYTGDWRADVAVNPEGEQVKEGDSAQAVLAVAPPYWEFLCWDDGNRNPYRHDVNVEKDIILQAIFAPVEPDPMDNEDGNSSSQPSDSQNSEDDGKPEESDDGNPDNSDGEQDNQQNQEQQPAPEPSDGNDASGMRDLASQQFKDGQTYFGDESKFAHDSALERLEQDNNIPDELKEHIMDYFESLDTNSGIESDNDDDEE